MDLGIETEEGVDVSVSASCVRPQGRDCGGCGSSSGPAGASVWPGPPLEVRAVVVAAASAGGFGAPSFLCSTVVLPGSLLD